MSKKKLFGWCLAVLLPALAVGLFVYFVALHRGFFGRIVLIVLGFGAVVLVHEFGHFIVAKLAGIKVEAFSIGFPPVLAGFTPTGKGWLVRVLPDFFKQAEKDGDKVLPASGTGNKAGACGTEYRIGLIPFGGYVKMLGQDDIGPAKSSDDSRSYANKPPGVRMAVISAGVLFNIISAAIAFMTVFLIGIGLPPPVVGSVVPNSPAALAGLRPGDEIIEIDGDSYNLDFANIAMAEALSGANEPVELKVKHADGSVEDFAIVARKGPEGKLKQFGVLPALSLKVAEVSDPNRLFEETSLKSGDRIRAVNGRDVESYWQLEQALKGAYVPKVAVLAERGKGKDLELVESEIPLSLSFADSYEIDSESQLHHIYSMVPRLQIAAVSEELAGRDSSCTVRAGDIILAIGDVENPSYIEMRRVINEYEGRELDIKLLRVGADGCEKSLTASVVPERKDGRVVIGVALVLDAEHAVVAKTIEAGAGPEPLEIPRGALIEAVDGVEVSNFYDIVREIRRNAGRRITIDYRMDAQSAGTVTLDVGNVGEYITVRPALSIPFSELKRLYKADGLVDAVRMGYEKTWLFIAQTYATLRSLLTGLVSPKELMGPVGILKLSYDVVATQPGIYYVYLMGLISACIAVFNFLPILPFDGGHFLFLLIEKIKGSAVNQKLQEAASRVGWAAVLVLFLYVTFNDIIRSFFG